ncbi:MAG: hypothetical protein AAFV69_16015, partial [Pseudomonadota bacterium]
SERFNKRQRAISYPTVREQLFATLVKWQKSRTTATVIGTLPNPFRNTAKMWSEMQYCKTAWRLAC